MKIVCVNKTTYDNEYIESKVVMVVYTQPQSKTKVSEKAQVEMITKMLYCKYDALYLIDNYTKRFNDDVEFAHYVESIHIKRLK